MVNNRGAQTTRNGFDGAKMARRASEVKSKKLRKTTGNTTKRKKIKRPRKKASSPKKSSKKLKRRKRVKSRAVVRNDEISPSKFKKRKKKKNHMRHHPHQMSILKTSYPQSHSPLLISHIPYPVVIFFSEYQAGDKS